MKRFFTGCEHYCGGGISKYAKRPFKSIEHMNERQIANSNMRVKPEDTVYHVGDFFSYGREKGIEGLRLKPQDIISQLAGRHLFIEGNHCKNNKVKVDCGYMFMNIGKYRAIVTHYPLDNPINTILGKKFWQEIVKFAFANTEFCINSHVHQSWETRVIDLGYKKYPMINVGVDACKYMPISEQEIIQKVSKLLGK